MSHMVIYRSHDGQPGYQQVDGIHEAVVFVEEMRNREGVEQARIFRLEEVVFEYKPYFRVELAEGDVSSLEMSMSDLESLSTGSRFGDSRVDEISLMDATAANSGDYSFDHPNAEVLAAVTREASYEPVDPSMVLNVDTVEAEVSANGARRGLFGG